MKDKFIDECKIIQQNSTYTAEAHHQEAQSLKLRLLFFEIVPAVCTAVSATLVAAKWAPEKLIFLTLITSIVTALTAVVNPRKSYEAHLSAAKNFTTMKHDSRFLQTAQSLRLDENEFATAVEKLHNRYTDLTKSSPPTSAGSFDKARKIIQARIHEPDKDSEGNIA